MKVLIPVDGSNSKESEGGSDSKESAYNAEDPGSIPGLENPLEKVGLPPPVFLPGKSMARAAVNGVAKSQT